MDSDDAATRQADELEQLRHELLRLRERAGVLEERFHGVIESAADGMLVFQHDGLLAFANRAATEALDLEFEEGAGEPASVAVSTRHGAGRFALRVVPSTWDGRAASLVILSPVSRRSDAFGAETGAVDDQPDPMVSRGVPDNASHVTPDRNGSMQAVTFHCTIDDLSRMAAQFGAPVADDVAAEIERRLRSVIRAVDTSARIGDRAFAVRCRGVDQSHAPVVAARLTRTIEDPMTIAGINLALSVTLTFQCTDDDHARSNVAPAHHVGPPPSRTLEDKRGNLRGVLFSGPGQVP
jgi:diguanylate cyclase with GGDEF domain